MLTDDQIIRQAFEILQRRDIEAARRSAMKFRSPTLQVECHGTNRGIIYTLNLPVEPIVAQQIITATPDSEFTVRDTYLFINKALPENRTNSQPQNLTNPKKEPTHV